MNSFPATIPGFYAYWMKLGWSMLIGQPQATLSERPPSRFAQAEAEHEWEQEGGRVTS
ncbi:MAG: hypothetical protein ABI423_14655 [Burkholderiales bacterium]